MGINDQFQVRWAVGAAPVWDEPLTPDLSQTVDAGSPERPARGRVDRCVFRQEGEYWTVVYLGRTIRLRDSTGLRHLSQLLWHPGREFYATELMQALALCG